MSHLFPLPFYLCCVAVVVLAVKAWCGRHEAWGIPMGAVVFTAASWYLGDALYNNYEGYLQILGCLTLKNAWWEVLLFFISFGIFVPIVNRKINGKLPAKSRILEMIGNLAIDTESFQRQITKIAGLLVIPWSLLMLAALVRTDFNFTGIFFPYLDEKVDPWARDRLGSGMDAVYALASYFQIMLASLFGVALALSRSGFTMLLSGTIYFLSVPFYIFDRTRNTMIAVLLPGFMALVTLRIRRGMLFRLVVVIGAFLALEGWMKFVIENRDSTTVVGAVKMGGAQDADTKSRKHLGFNMFEELGYINRYIEDGSYKVNWGERYFAELVNPVPRVLWPEKPLIGIDYAIARGMAYGNQSLSSGGVACSVSTGMIGQGVVNFGRILGPIAAAFLMALWVAVLARQDLMGNDIGHLLLYAIGLVLTFNMGRDITLLVIYPFVFGWLLLTWLNRKNRVRTPGF